MKQGRLTIPTDANYVEGTKKFIERWGADAVRDCDGTELPVGVSKLAKKVYKTYFVVRGDIEGTDTQPIRGAIMSLTSLAIKHFNDDIQLAEGDLVVLGGHLYSVENPSVSHKCMPKRYNIYFATLNSIK